jgi:hypothetical protein
VGYGLTVAPEQIENAMSDALPSEYAADLIIDGSGFILSEGAGLLAGSYTISSGPGAYGAKLVFDVLAGAAWDEIVERNQIREGVQSFIEDSVTNCFESLSNARDPRVEPVPTPGEVANPTETPVPLKGTPEPIP